MNSKVMITIKGLQVNQILALQGVFNKFPDCFRMGTFIDSTHMKIYSSSK